MKKCQRECLEYLRKREKINFLFVVTFSKDQVGLNLVFRVCWVNSFNVLKADFIENKVIISCYFIKVTMLFYF